MDVSCWAAILIPVNGLVSLVTLVGSVMLAKKVLPFFVKRDRYSPANRRIFQKKCNTLGK